MNGVLELKEFFVEGNEHEKSHVILHITEPSVNDVKKGYFFALAEIKDGEREEIIELEKIFDDLEKSYYNTVDSREKSALELSLEFINRRAGEVLKNSEATIDCLVGVLENFHLVFSIHGNPLGFLFYSKEGKLEHLSIVEREKEGFQFFSSLTEGDLHIGDSLLIATPQMTEFFSLDRLEKLILTRNTKESVEHIEKVLRQLRSGDSYGGILFHSARKNEIHKSDKKPRDIDHGSVASLQSLLQKEKETTSTLSPPLFQDTREKLKTFFEEKTSAPPKEEETTNTPPLKKDNSTSPDHFPKPKKTKRRGFLDFVLLGLGQILVAVFKGAFALMVSVLKFIQESARSLFFLASNRHGQRAHVLRNIKLGIQRKKEYFAALPLLSKILFGAAVLSLIIFVSSVFYLRIEKQKTATNERYNNLVAAIEEKKNAAEASLLYNDTERAVTLTEEAQKYIEELRQLPPRENTVEILETELKNITQKLQKITEVNTVVLFSLPEQFPQANTDRMIKLAEQLVISGVSDGNLYIFDLNKKEITAQLHDTIPLLGPQAVPKEQDKIIFGVGENRVAEFDQKTQTLSAKDINFPTPNTKMVALSMYNRRLYTVDTNNNQIFKHNQTSTGYDKGTSWVNDSTVDIKNAISLAIDGDLFILKADGNVIKMSGGKSVPFSLSGLAPVLTAPTQIWTYSDVSSVYILEAKTKRVVVFDKEGKFIKQYTSSSWESPSSLVIDEKEKKVYVLDKNKVYEFGL